MQDTTIPTSESELTICYGETHYRKEPRADALASAKYLSSDLTDIRRHYLRLGFHLEEFCFSGYYLDFGFPTLEAFCEANLGLDKSAVSRCIGVYREFNASRSIHCQNGIAVKGAATELAEEWRAYSYTQLCELLPLTPEERKGVTPDMPVKQIRAYKKQLRQGKGQGDPDAPQGGSRKTDTPQKEIHLPAPGNYTGLGDPAFRAYLYRCLRTLLRAAFPGRYQIDLSPSSARYRFQDQALHTGYNLTWTSQGGKQGKAEEGSRP